MAQSFLMPTYDYEVYRNVKLILRKPILSNHRLWSVYRFDGGVEGDAFFDLDIEEFGGYDIVWKSGR